MEMLKQALLKLSKNSGVQLSLLSLSGGLIFVVFFYWAYSNIDSSLYEVCDDGVITMSHAKNLVDYGFIGVNPSGGRVEGYSAPVQFFIYAAAYGLTGIGYETYTDMQTDLFTFLLGALFILFFKENRARALALSVLAAFILSTQMPFLKWHGSGMENPITHVLFLATLLILYSFAKDEKINYPIACLWAIIVFLATISRLESVYHIAPLLVIFSGFWLFRFKNFSGFYFSFLVFILWFSYHLWRYIYFGDLLPNTAYAQGISIGDRLLNWQLHLDQSIRLANRIFFSYGVYLLLAVMPLLLFVRRQKAVLLFFLLIGSLVLTAYFHPFVFGPVRISPIRTTTHLALFMALGITAIFYFIEHRFMENKKYILWIAPASLLVGLLAVFNATATNPYRRICVIAWPSDRSHGGLAKIESLPRPTIANPDLGAMSWQKRFNIVDLGWLGSPIMAKLKNRPIVSDYFFDYAAPDMFQSHVYWSCVHKKYIFEDPRFREIYTPVGEKLVKSRRHCDGTELITGRWVRKDIQRGAKTKESILIDDVKINLSVDRLRQELDDCQSNPQRNCVYVARTAFRFLPEFRDKEKIDALNEVFLTSRTKDYDLYLINGYKDGQAHVSALEYIVSQYIIKVQSNRPVIRSNYDVYIHNNSLVYVRNACKKEDIKFGFFLHVKPKNKEDLPSGQNLHNLDFNFKSVRGMEFKGKCIAIRKLPNYDIDSIQTGQYTPLEGRTWDATYPFSK